MVYRVHVELLNERHDEIMLILFPIALGILHWIEVGRFETFSAVCIGIGVAAYFFPIIALKIDDIKLAKKSDVRAKILSPLWRKENEWLETGNTDEILSAEVEGYSGQTEEVSFGGKLDSGNWSSDQVLEFFAKHGVRDTNFTMPSEADFKSKQKIEADTVFKGELNEVINARDHEAWQKAVAKKKNLIKSLDDALPKINEIQEWLLINLEGWLKQQVSAGHEFPLKLSIHGHKELRKFSMDINVLTALKKLELPVSSVYGPFTNHTRNDLFRTMFIHSKNAPKLYDYISQLGLTITDYDESGTGELLIFALSENNSGDT